MRAVGAFAVAVMVVAAVHVVAADTDLTLEISNASADEEVWMEAFDGHTVAFADFDGDGHAEIVAHNDNQRIYVLSSKEPKVLAEFRPKYPPGWKARALNDPAVGDVDGDGELDLVVVNSAAYACRYEFDPAASTSSDFRFVERWCRRADTYDGYGAAADAGAWLEDVDGDGQLESFFQTEKRGLFALRPDGSILWSRNKTGGNAGPLVTDLENDGRKEVIFFSDGGAVRAFDARTGSTRWEFHSSRHVWPASMPDAGAAGDLDGDGKKEVVAIARDAHNEVDLQDNDFLMVVLGHDGKLKWKVQPEWGHPMSSTIPIIHDVDGDGKREIVGGDWNTMGHKPGDWESLGRNNVFAYNHDGSLLWRTVLDNTWSSDDLALADADGDGKLEVLAISRGPNGDGVWYLDAKTGAKEKHVGSGPWTALKGPTVGDLDFDGDADWVLSIHTGAKGGGFRVYDTDAPCRAPFGGKQVRDPCDLPRRGHDPRPVEEEKVDEVEPEEDEEPEGDGFRARFVDPHGNPWWIEVRVEASQPLASVDVRLDGGAWRPLDLRSWGAWAKSYPAPEGTVVQVRARAESGDEVLSSCWRWTRAAPVACPEPPPPPPAFDASFSRVHGNSWWIEANVAANEPLAGVEARLGNGPWVPLRLRSWGAWADSYRAPEGTVVQLRAQSADGDVDHSGCHRWTSGAPVSCDADRFEAEFRPSGNAWWVQVRVEADAKVVGVDARVDDGAWKPLVKRSWGAWAAGLRAPAGSEVEFRARSEAGDVATSRAFPWPPP